MRLQAMLQNVCITWENDEETVIYLVGIFRVLSSIASIIATLTIILPAAVQKQLSNPNVHPLVVLSLCDCLLSFLWLGGSGLLLTPSHGNSSSCITLSALTVILQCITINMTLLYAFIAFLHARQAGANFAALQRYNSCYCFGYLIACILPFVLVLVPFGAVITFGLVLESSHHICGCFPDFSNLLPHLNNHTYIVGKYQLSVTLATVIIGHCIVAFPLLCVLYCKVLQLFKRARISHGLNQRAHSASTEGFMAVRLRQAQKSVTAFLLLFIMSRACNLVLAVMAVVSGAYLIDATGVTVPGPVKALQTALLIIQSIITPLQGFLNAVVYGWTRGTFRQLILNRNREQRGVSMVAVNYGSLQHDTH